MTVRITPAVVSERVFASAVAVADPQSAAISMLPCTRRQLEVFLEAVADCHFARTAQRLGISQAAVSSHIAALEKQFGKPLFVRKRGRKPVISTFGLDLSAEARALLGTAPGHVRSAVPVKAGRPMIRVGAGAHLIDDHIKRHLPQFCKQHPELDIACEYAEEPNECLSQLRNGSVDIVVHTVSNPVSPPLHAEILGAARLGLYAGGELRSKRYASPEELSQLPFVLPIEDSPSCRMIRAALAKAGIRAENVIAHVQYANVAKALARQGEGLAVLFTTMVGPEDANELIMLDVELTLMYRTLFRAHGGRDRAMRTVENFLREILVC